MKCEKSMITTQTLTVINKLLETQSKYELSLNIGISESTLYKYVNGYEISNIMANKIKNYLKIK